MLYYIIPCILFILDCTSYYLFHAPIINFLLSYFCFEFIMNGRRIPLGVTLIFLTIEPVLFYGRFGINLLFLAPIMIGMTMSLSHLHSKRLALFLMAFLSIIAQILLIEHLLLGLAITGLYTFLALFATLIVHILSLYIFELKI